MQARAGKASGQSADEDFGSDLSKHKVEPCRGRSRNLKKGGPGRGGGGGGVQQNFLQKKGRIFFKKKGGGGPTTYSGAICIASKEIFLKKGGPDPLDTPPGSAPALYVPHPPFQMLYTGLLAVLILPACSLLVWLHVLIIINSASVVKPARTFDLVLGCLDCTQEG